MYLKYILYILYISYNYLHDLKNSHSKMIITVTLTSKNTRCKHQEVICCSEKQVIFDVVKMQTRCNLDEHSVNTEACTSLPVLRGDTLIERYKVSMRDAST